MKMFRESKREKGVVKSKAVNVDDVCGLGGKKRFWTIFASYAALLTITFCIILLVDSSTKRTGLQLVRSFGQWWSPSSLEDGTSGTSMITNWYNILVPESSNYTSTLTSLLLANATMTAKCQISATSMTKLEGLPDSIDGKFFFGTDKLHRLTLVAYDENGEQRCGGGDYYEVDFHDRDRTHFLSRLPTTDFGNGSYGLEIFVPSRFAGAFTLDVYILYGNWHGLDMSTSTWAKTDNLTLTQELEMVVKANDHDHHSPQKPALEKCTPADFDRTTWQGRWTRTWFNSSCEPDMSTKRYLCLPEEHYWCEEPWCFGPVGRLEGNGWQYSAHCGFKIFKREEAWKCLDGRWFMMWGDSNFQDTIRNLLLFIMDWSLPSSDNLADFQLSRTYEMAFTNSYNYSQLFRVSPLFNGAHWVHGNGEGMKTLTHKDHQENLIAHFNGTKWPDTIILNSGLHDGSTTVENYAEAADAVIEFWAEVYNSLPVGRRPTVIWRATVAPAGIGRDMPSNPMKMEMYNQLMAEKLEQAKDRLPVMFVDAFDLTFPFHYDNNFSDGGHYGRAPGVDLWPWHRKPHWYFVDVMLAHILLNALCPSS
ncbi:unnamed protein product [Calypogeia fissa]